MKAFYLSLLCTLLASLVILGSCRKEVSPETEASDNPQANAIDPGQGPSNTTLYITGKGLGDIRSIVFETDSVPAAFNPVLNTEESIIFRVPEDAVPGQQDIVFTNGKGITFTIPFNVLGLATITDVSNYNFFPGEQLTLTGKNLADVTDVVFAGSTEVATVISKTATTLVIQMPATTLNRTYLSITNAAGASTTTQEFINRDNALKIFTDDYGAGFSDGSWGPNAISTTVFKAGTASAAKTLPKSQWWVAGFTGDVNSDPTYAFLSFWIKGGLIDQTLYITGDKRAIGFGNSDQNSPISIPANVWTYFKIPINSLNLWATGTPFNKLGFWIKGPDNADETFYFDDVIIVK